MTEPKKVRVRVSLRSMYNLMRDLNPMFNLNSPQEVELEATLVEEEVWPKVGGKFYVPALSYAEQKGNYTEYIYNAGDFDRWAFNKCLASKTKEEAIALANYLIEKAKEWKR